MSEQEKKEIALHIVDTQNKVATLPKSKGYGYLSSYEDVNYKKSWKDVILKHLDRSRGIIKENKILHMTRQLLIT